MYQRPAFHRTQNAPLGPPSSDMDSCLGILSEFQISMQRFFSLVVRVRQKTGGAHRGVTKHVTSGRSIENLEFVVLSSSLRRFSLTCLCCGVVPPWQLLPYFPPLVRRFGMDIESL